MNEIEDGGRAAKWKKWLRREDCCLAHQCYKWKKEEGKASVQEMKEKIIFLLCFVFSSQCLFKCLRNKIHCDK